MLDIITPDSVASEIRLLREDTNYQGAFLFVEGETDYALFANYFTQEKCNIKRLKGKDNVLNLIEIMVHSGDSLCFAIVDADFWHIEKKQPPHENIFVTDTHDIETQIFISPAVEKVCRELFPSGETQGIIERLSSIRSQIMTAASRMAIIRFANYKRNLNICFYIDKDNSEVINWEPAINIRSFSVNFEHLLRIVCREDYSQIIRIRPHINQCSEECRANKYNLLQLCNGHDVVFVTLLYLKSNGKKKECENLSSKDLEKMLRLAYEADFFRETNLYKNLLAWQNTLGMEILKISTH